MFKLQLFISLFTALFIINSYADSPAVLLGEKLFNDARFSKSNKVSCSTCHMIDQKFDQIGMRGYADNEARTALVLKVDGKGTTNRNTQALIGIGSKYLEHHFAHHDGELSFSDTYLGNFTGMNMGWGKADKQLALDNLVKTIRNDKGDLANGEFSYETLLLGVDPALTEELRLPEHQRVDITKLSDKELIKIAVKFGTDYLFNIDFETDEEGNYSGSPYDKFLKANNIDRGPKKNETPLDYTRRLLKSIRALVNPVFIEPEYYENHQKNLQFKQQELDGLNVFISNGRCINCHTAPLFTDQLFHNVGVTQDEYDAKNGANTFMQLQIPTLSKRNEVFMMEKDLGVWNWFAKSDQGKLTSFIKNKFCRDPQTCDESQLLDAMIARFKTPTLRNLSMSTPYFHNGKFKTLKDSIVHYQKMSDLLRAGKMRNPAPQMRMMHLNSKDISDLEAFMNALNENYD